MKSIIFCTTLVSLLRALNGSVLQTGADLGRGLSNLGYSYGVPYGPAGLSYGTPNSLGFTINTVPYYWTNYGTNYEVPCSQRITVEAVTDFRVSVYRFITDLFKKTAVLGEGHFVFSPFTVWLSMAALAEGTEEPSRQEMFNILNLPEDRCLRKVFYKVATSLENPSNDVILARNRLFVTDSSLHVNKYWENIVRSQTNLNAVSVPFKNNPFIEIEALKRIFNAQLPNINLNGNSFLLESLDYRGLWSSAFSDAVIETGPFYNTFGEQVGTMEYMKITKRVKVAYLPSTNMKVLELPVGRDERYKMLFAIILGKEDYGRSINSIKNSLIFETLENMRETPRPIEIVIPRLTMTSETDVRKVLEDMGITSLWTDPSVTRNISDPAALPSSFIQRVTVTLDNGGVRPFVQEYHSFVPPVLSSPDYSHGPDVPVPEIFKDFIANTPFMFGIFDSETYMCLFAAAFSKPNN